MYICIWFWLQIITKLFGYSSDRLVKWSLTHPSAPTSEDCDGCQACMDLIGTKKQHGTAVSLASELEVRSRLVGTGGRTGVMATLGA